MPATLLTEERKMSGCDHYWFYKHIVYSGLRGGTLVRKWCAKCGIERVGEVTKWREPRPKEFDEAAAAIRLGVGEASKEVS